VKGWYGHRDYAHGIDLDGLSAEHREYILEHGLKNWLERYEMVLEIIDSKQVAKPKNENPSRRSTLSTGRPRKFESNAEKQRAYRNTKTTGVTK
jgi:hypothetical protein